MYSYFSMDKPQGMVNSSKKYATTSMKAKQTLKALLTCLNDGRPKSGITSDNSQLTCGAFLPSPNSTSKSSKTILQLP